MNTARSGVLAAIVVALTTCAATAKEPNHEVTFAPPRLVVAVAIDDETLEVYTFATRRIARGIPVDTKGKVFRQVFEGTVLETGSERISLNELRVKRINGDAVTTKVLLKELAKPTPVLFAGDDGTVDAVFAQMFRPKTLVLHRPSSGAPVRTFHTD